MTHPDALPFTFADGVRPHLISLEQTRTYAGWLEGVPNTVMDARMIERASAGIDLVQPPRVEPLEAEVPASWGRAEALPSIQVRARFSSHQTRQPNGLNSALSVMWWQDNFIEHLDEELNAVATSIS